MDISRSVPSDSSGTIPPSEEATNALTLVSCSATRGHGRADAGAHCAEPRGSRISVHGAQNVAGYDPVTGQAIGPDGGPITIGSFGGQQRYLGKDAWTWLLIGPLAG
jgi:hypothetical protein